ncbi:MAG: UpxY family transcription antiterminator [Bacteroidales bacterium]|nr:UpxY family transcription antiterminator [Bacteroidales bacterium]MCF6342309.1 UpxY family transcription antiterminator [Bacteroidales bacterium]
MNKDLPKSWFAVYVKSRAEKKAAAEFLKEGIAYFLPLIKVLRQWSDRKKWVEVPLFRSYIFVHIEPKDYFRVLQVNGVIRYITFEGKAVSIPVRQIEAIRYYLNGYEQEATDDNTVWEKGKKVEIISGSLAGLTGELVEVKGKHKINIEIEAVGKTILIEVKKNKLRLL